jgi:hypothetical protein
MTDNSIRDGLTQSWKSIIQISFAFGLLMVSSGAAQADQYYPFINVECDPSSQTMKIAMRHPQDGDNPEQILVDVRSKKMKGMYYLIDIAKEPKQKVTCDLSDGNVVSFIGWFDGDHMANDNLQVSLNNIGIGELLASLSDHMTIKVLGNSEAITENCRLDWNNQPIQKMCETKYFKNGKMSSQ